MSQSFKHHFGNNCITISMNHSKSNAINHSFLDRLIDTFSNSHSDLPIVLKGNEQFFSCGLDLFSVHKMNEKELVELIYKFQNLLNIVLNHPNPVIGYIEGHAVAGGFILASACDHVFIHKSNSQYGMNEQKLGITLPPLPNAILQWTYKHKLDKILCAQDYFSYQDILEFNHFSLLNSNCIPVESISRNFDRKKFIDSYMSKYAERDMKMMIESWFSQQAFKGREKILQKLKCKL